jgi:Amt family ammonium transporter
MNLSAEKLTLWSREKVVGSPITQVLNLEDLQGNSLMQRVLDTHRLHPEHPLQFGQVKLYPRVGEYRFVELNTTCIQEERKAVVFIFRDVTADRKVINRLYRQASRDPLTDLMNRGSFEQYMEQLAHDTSSLARTHVLASIDLDNFKIINDTCGHLAGDELLKQVAHIFRRSIRNSDKAARIGGDEFAIFLESCGVEKGRSIMESILVELRNFRFSWEGKIFSIGASIGLLEFMPSTHIQIKQLFSDADKACYTAKALGRNQVFIHAEQTIQEMSSQRVHDWSKLLKDAIREDRFILFAQPIAALRPEHANAFRQYEVLLRLPFRQTLLNPGSFLPVADRLELTASIDRWIIRKSLEMLAECRCQDNSGQCVETRLMINLSSQSVQSAELLQFVESQIRHFSIKPGSICFEISESVAISNFVHAKRLMNALHELGCHLVLDDFGSGFSSLNYLRELPLTYLKIDGNFVHNLVSNRVDAAMVKAVHEVGQVMNLLTIAELVEDAETLSHLRKIGVDFAQGYYCGRPIPLAQLCERIKNEVSMSLS